MVKDFGCKACGLRFRLGWYHCHTITEDGCRSPSLLVYTHCRSQHAIRQMVFAADWARLRTKAATQSDQIRLSSPGRFPFGGPIKEFETGVVGARGPRFDGDAPSSYPPCNAEATVKTRHRREYRESSPGGYAEETSLRPEDIVCVHCGAEWSIVGQWPHGEAIEESAPCLIRFGRWLGMLDAPRPGIRRQTAGECPNCKEKE